MSIFSKRRRNSDDDTELNMIPIMNIFLVIIPFLLTSISFYHIKAISTSVPAMADSSQQLMKSEKIKLTVIVELRQSDMRLSATSEEIDPQALEKFEELISLSQKGVYPLNKLNEYLQSIKLRHPASDTLILIPDEAVKYESIIQAMDAARKFNSTSTSLFPNVVLSGSLG
jgi:biopolymer transport protein ExbD